MMFCNATVRRLALAQLGQTLPGTATCIELKRRADISALQRYVRHTMAARGLFLAGTIVCATLIGGMWPTSSAAQPTKVRVAVPGYTIAVLSFLAAKMNGYYAAEALDVELIAMRAPTANLALIAGNVEFSAVPLAGLTTALRGAPLKLLFCQFDKPQHALYARPELSDIKALRGKKVAVSGLGTIDDILLREALSGHGIDPVRELTILAMGAADTRFGALATGAIDASVLIAPSGNPTTQQTLTPLPASNSTHFST